MTTEQINIAIACRGSCQNNRQMEGGRMTTEQRNDAQEVIELTNYIGATLGISPQNIFGKSRIPEHADARAICQYVLRSRGWNYQRIADSYGQKCHATAMHNVARIERMMKLSNAVELGLALNKKHWSMQLREIDAQ